MHTYLCTATQSYEFFDWSSVCPQREAMDSIDLHLSFLQNRSQLEGVLLNDVRGSTEALKLCNPSLDDLAKPSNEKLTPKKN